MADLDLAALRAKARSDNERVFCVVLHSDKLNALIDRLERAESAKKRSTDILRIAENDADVARAYRGEAEEEISRLRGLLARAGETLKPFAERGEKWAQNSDAARVSVRLGDLRAARDIAHKIEEIGHE